MSDWQKEESFLILLWECQEDGFVKWNANKMSVLFCVQKTKNNKRS